MSNDRKSLKVFPKVDAAAYWKINSVQQFLFRREKGRGTHGIRDSRRLPPVTPEIERETIYALGCGELYVREPVGLLIGLR